MLINREPLRHLTFDVELLGDCDVIVSELCQRLGGTWSGLSDDLEIPCVKRLRSLPAKLTSVEERIEERGHSSGEKETSEVSIMDRCSGVFVCVLKNNKQQQQQQQKQNQSNQEDQLQQVLFQGGNKNSD